MEKVGNEIGKYYQIFWAQEHIPSGIFVSLDDSVPYSHYEFDCFALAFVGGKQFYTIDLDISIDVIMRLSTPAWINLMITHNVYKIVVAFLYFRQFQEDTITSRSAWGDNASIAFCFHCLSWWNGDFPLNFLSVQQLFPWRWRQIKKVLQFFSVIQQ